jgi:predicted flap endonuclease-1-like 5' DNA nuclease
VSIEAQMAIVEKLHRLTGDAIAGLRADLDAAAARAEAASGLSEPCAEHGCRHPEDNLKSISGMGGARPKFLCPCGCVLVEDIAARAASAIAAMRAKEA